MVSPLTPNNRKDSLMTKGNRPERIGRTPIWEDATEGEGLLHLPRGQGSLRGHFEPRSDASPASAAEGHGVPGTPRVGSTGRSISVPFLARQSR